eukprot:1027223-Prymnesium_polylepis.1
MKTAWIPPGTVGEKVGAAAARTARTPSTWRPTLCAPHRVARATPRASHCVQPTERKNLRATPRATPRNTTALAPRSRRARAVALPAMSSRCPCRGGVADRRSRRASSSWAQSSSRSSSATSRRSSRLSTPPTRSDETRSPRCAGSQRRAS